MSFAAHSSALAVVAISVLTSLVSEAVSWFYIYRHASWRSARASLGRATKKVDALRSEVALGEAGTKQKKTSKKVGKAETNLKQTMRELQTLNVRGRGGRGRQRRSAGLSPACLRACRLTRVHSVILACRCVPREWRA